MSRSGFDEREHPRWLRGSGDRSGEFREKTTGWAAQAAQNLGRGHLPADELAGMVSRAEYVAPLRGGSMATTRLMHDPQTGQHLVHKVHDRQHDDLGVANRHRTNAELAASWVGQTLGIPAPTVVPDPSGNPQSVYMQYVVGDVAETRSDLAGGFFPVQRIANSGEGVMLGLMDALISNGDRHPGNWLMNGRGRLVPIDHGESFDLGGRVDSSGEILPKKFWRHAGFTPPWMDFSQGADPVWKATNPLHPDDVPVLRRRLQGLGGRFAAVGWQRQHEQMMQQFEALARRAAGTVRLFP